MNKNYINLKYKLKKQKQGINCIRQKSHFHAKNIGKKITIW